MNRGRRMREMLQYVARFGLVGAALVAPWLFGAYSAWAYLLICLVVMVATGSWLLQVVLHPRARLRFPLTTLFLVLILGLTALQIVPLPASFVKTVAPRSAAIQQEQARLFREMEMSEFLPGAGEPEDAMTLSTAPASTRHSLFIITAFVSAFVVAANSFRKWEQLRGPLMGLVISGFAMAVLGIIHEFSGSSRVLWFHETHFGGSIFGPFANPNHYATFMNLMFGLTVGFVLAEMRGSPLRTLDSWREKVSWMSGGKANRIAFVAFAAAVMGASVFVSLSRGGIVCLMLAVAVLVLWAGWRSAESGSGPRIAAVALLVLAVVTWLGWNPVVRELSTLADVAPAREGRTVASLATLEMFGTSPVLGYGFGSFAHVFPIFQRPAVQTGRWLHAHNEYAQLLAEGGLIGTGLVLCAVAAFLWEVYRNWDRAAERGRLLALGLGVGFVATALHSAISFGLRSPAMALFLAVTAGLCAAGCHLRKRRRRE